MQDALTGIEGRADCFTALAAPERGASPRIVYDDERDEFTVRL
jgi:hypothetical protein